jgi:magnesium transporter
MDVLIKDTVSLHEIVLKEVDEIEDLVFDVSTSGAYEITQMRQKIVRMKRVISPLKSILHELAIDQSGLAHPMSRNFKFLTHEVNKLRDSLEDAKEVIEIYKDADFTMSTDRTNKILGILTIIFTLAIPAQIVGSFYGMNVLIPGGIEAGSWDFFGPFTTFYFVITVAVLPAVVMLWLFKSKKWF